MEIILQSGRTIRLARIEQWRTYAGLLCGQPTSEQNEEKLHELFKLAREQYTMHAAVLIPPPVGARLPAISCVATFNSNELARPDSEPYSSLGVAWLQEEFALPIDARVVELIRQIAWEEVAVDWCW